MVRNKVQIAGTLTMMMDIGAMARSEKKRGSRDVMSIVPIIRYRPTIVNPRIVNFGRDFTNAFFQPTHVTLRNKSITLVIYLSQL
jgi:hypothetical protein